MAKRETLSLKSCPWRLPATAAVAVVGSWGAAPQACWSWRARRRDLERRFWNQ
jgi:hypothetical protein